MKLSIVTTLYHSSIHIDEFYRRTSIVAQKLVGNDYEIILVNDGSPDNSLNIASEFTEIDPHITVIDLSRNFGHHKAMMTGLSYAKGELIFLIDSDLEEEPEWLLNFFHEIEKQQCDVIYGSQIQRKGGIFERWSGQWFWYIFNKMTGMSLTENSVTARLMTKRYVNALLLHKEREVFIMGLWHLTGFDQQPQKIKKHSSSKSTYTIHKKISLLVNAITSFSNAPLISIFYLGFIISFLSGTYITYLVIQWIFFLKPLLGWTSVIASIWFLGGLTMSSLGVIGIYLSKIFLETKKRPYTIIRKIYTKKKGGGDEKYK
ncbi:MAG: glycosyltransferase family 2 protein [Gammaproteobacteria bacterium]|nr:glycosyltransferase family 2 protein [Gammaproteobacteria bacterium]